MAGVAVTKAGLGRTGVEFHGLLVGLGDLDVSDPVAILLSLFAGGIALPPPGPEPGMDPTLDELGCVGGHTARGQ